MQDLSSKKLQISLFPPYFSLKFPRQKDFFAWTCEKSCSNPLFSKLSSIGTYSHRIVPNWRVSQKYAPHNAKTPADVLSAGVVHT